MNNTAISTREKIGTLIKRFLRHLDDSKNTIFEINTLALEGSRIFKDLKKALDMIFYLEGLGILLRISPEHIIYVGFKGMTRKLYEYENGIFPVKSAKYCEEILLEGKLTLVRSHNLGGFLLGNIFFNLIYKKESLTKSSVEQMAENFMAQQKQFSSKNFVPQVLNILTNLNLVEKNESTEVITYIGPDLKIYDENNRKITWKIYQIMRREEQAIGKEQFNQIQTKNQGPKTATHPQSAHITYFPELSYAVLRSNNWQKNITKTVFFIGRDKKTELKHRKHQIDLQLPYKSVSRQHAVIVYNYEACKWEIRCLSRKNLIKVDDERFAWGDQNIWLKNKSEIQIGPQKMVFLEAIDNYS